MCAVCEARQEPAAGIQPCADFSRVIQYIDVTTTNLELSQAGTLQIGPLSVERATASLRAHACCTCSGPVRVKSTRPGQRAVASALADCRHDATAAMVGQVWKLCLVMRTNCQLMASEIVRGLSLRAALSIVSGTAQGQSCERCACRGGPGYRDARGKCVGHAQLFSRCGIPPTTRCTFEGQAFVGRNAVPPGLTAVEYTQWYSKRGGQQDVGLEDQQEVQKRGAARRSDPQRSRAAGHAS